MQNQNYVVNARGVETEDYRVTFLPHKKILVTNYERNAL